MLKKGKIGTQPKETNQNLVVNPSSDNGNSFGAQKVVNPSSDNGFAKVVNPSSDNGFGPQRVVNPSSDNGFNH